MVSGHRLWSWFLVIVSGHGFWSSFLVMVSGSCLNPGEMPTMQTQNARHYRPRLIVDQYMTHWLLCPAYSIVILFLYP